MSQYRVLSPLKIGTPKPIPVGETVEINDPAFVVWLQKRGVIGVAEPVADESPSFPSELLNVIAKVDADDADAWDKNGKPKLSVLNELADFKVTAVDRDAAWTAFLESEVKRAGA